MDDGTGRKGNLAHTYQRNKLSRLCSFVPMCMRTPYLSIRVYLATTNWLSISAHRIGRVEPPVSPGVFVAFTGGCQSARTGNAKKWLSLHGWVIYTGEAKVACVVIEQRVLSMNSVVISAAIRII